MQDNSIIFCKLLCYAIEKSLPAVMELLISVIWQLGSYSARLFDQNAFIRKSSQSIEIYKHYSFRYTILHLNSCMYACHKPCFIIIYFKVQLFVRTVTKVEHCMSTTAYGVRGMHPRNILKIRLYDFRLLL